MSYVYGLGDAQEDEARRFEMQYGWLHELTIKCPKCGKTECVEVEDWETEYEEVYEIWTLQCICWSEECQDIDQYIEYEHWIWYK